ncbi:MAG: HigA family addiction module antidote protein [Acidobacteriota bacterium]|nr:HigA family addiction module antidote protein [Acidobacteriota bacterium]
MRSRNKPKGSLAESIQRGLRDAVHIAQKTKNTPLFASNSRSANRQAAGFHPGEFLREDFLIPLQMTPRMLADEIKVPERRVVAIVKEQRSLDADLCLRLARYFRMSPQFWMNLQKGYELETAMRDWPRIRREVPMHPTNRKTGGLRVPASK